MPKAKELMGLTEKEKAILKSFRYAPPRELDTIKYQEVAEALENAAAKIIQYVPDCADRTHALRQLRDTRMWSNAAIALQGLV